MTVVSIPDRQEAVFDAAFREVYRTVAAQRERVNKLRESIRQVEAALDQINRLSMEGVSAVHLKGDLREVRARLNADAGTAGGIFDQPTG